MNPQFFHLSQTSTFNLNFQGEIFLLAKKESEWLIFPHSLHKQWDLPFLVLMTMIIAF